MGKLFDILFGAGLLAATIFTSASTLNERVDEYYRVRKAQQTSHLVSISSKLGRVSSSSGRVPNKMSDEELVSSSEETSYFDIDYSDYAAFRTRVIMERNTALARIPEPRARIPEPRARNTEPETARNRNGLDKQLNQNYDEERFIQLVSSLKDGNIAHASVLRGIAYTESRFNFNVGCNAVDACGLMQLMRQGATAGVAAIFSDADKYKPFRSAFSEQILEKERQLEELVGPYFTELSDLSGKVKERYSEVEKEYKEVRKGHDTARLNTLGKELRLLFKLGQAITEGYEITYGVSLRKSNMLKRELANPKNGYDLNNYLIELTGEDIDWVGFLSQQQAQIEEIVSLSRDKQYPEVNVIVGDAFLGHLLLDRYDGNMKSALRFYCGGSASYANQVIKLAKDYLDKAN
ncbi:MAG: hypothetical protein ABIG89_01940 [Candidatus Woesearchaeota archaeon]